MTDCFSLFRRNACFDMLVAPRWVLVLKKNTRGPGPVKAWLLILLLFAHLFGLNVWLCESLQHMEHFWQNQPIFNVVYKASAPESPISARPGRSSPSRPVLGSPVWSSSLRRRRYLRVTIKRRRGPNQ